MLDVSSIRLAINTVLVEMFGRRKYCAFANPELLKLGRDPVLSECRVLNIISDSVRHAYKVFLKMDDLMKHMKSTGVTSGYVVNSAGYNNKITIEIHFLADGCFPDSIVQTTYIRVGSLEGVSQIRDGINIIGGV